MNRIFWIVAMTALLGTTAEAFERLDLTADEKAKIRSGNAMKLFGR